VPTRPKASWSRVHERGARRRPRRRSRSDRLTACARGMLHRCGQPPPGARPSLRYAGSAAAATPLHTKPLPSCRRAGALADSGRLSRTRKPCDGHGRRRETRQELRKQQVLPGVPGTRLPSLESRLLNLLPSRLSRKSQPATSPAIHAPLSDGLLAPSIRTNFVIRSCWQSPLASNNGNLDHSVDCRDSRIVGNWK